MSVIQYSYIEKEMKLMFNYCIDDVLDKFKKPKHKKDKKQKHREEETSTDNVSVEELEGVKEAIKAVDELTGELEKGADVAEEKINKVINQAKEASKSIIRDNKKSQEQQQDINHKNSKFRKENQKPKKEKHVDEDDDDMYSIIIDI